jgi:poly(3-hydroxybutyrate) depolymerase
MRLPKFTFIVAAMTLCAHTVSAEIMTWKVGDDTRSAIVYPPSRTSAGGKAPLIFSFHGRGDNMQNFQHTDMHRAWPEAIVVYFQGLPSRRDGLSGWQVEKRAGR